jgi:hypothetical protein
MKYIALVALMGIIVSDCTLRTQVHKLQHTITDLTHYI